MTRSLSGEELAKRTQERVADAVQEWNESALWVKPESIPRVMKHLKEDPELSLSYLNAITAVDYVEYFELVYHLTSFQHNHGAVIKAKVYGRAEPTVPSVVDLWRGADFQEREIWDLMGVRFTGHPNLKRLMLWEGFQGHPLRKDFEDTVVY